jgi:hypothetical protein
MALPATRSPETFYSSWPTAMTALQIAKRAFEEASVKPGRQGPSSTELSAILDLRVPMTWESGPFRRQAMTQNVEGKVVIITGAKRSHSYHSRRQTFALQQLE